LADVGRRRPRRSREEVSAALIEAAAALLAERPSGRVTVRDIAARADVNPALIHRYFGSKDDLLRGAMSRAQRNLTATVDEMPDVIEGAASIVHATLREREFIAALARATLDGVFRGIPHDSPALARLLERFEAEVESRGVRGRHEPDIVVACLAAAAVGYALLGPYIRNGTGLDTEPDDVVEARLVEVLRDVARLAFTE